MTKLRKKEGCPSAGGGCVLPVSEQTPDLPPQTGLQQHVHVLVVLKCAIQSAAKEAQTGLSFEDKGVM